MIRLLSLLRTRSYVAERPAAPGRIAAAATTRRASLAAAVEEGYAPPVVTDWRVTNLLASRFWPRAWFLHLVPTALSVDSLSLGLRRAAFGRLSVVVR